MKKSIYAASAFLFFAGSVAFGQAGNVGIGTTTPAAKLHVVGNVAVEDGTQAAGKVLTSDAVGVASWQSIPQPAGASITSQGTSYALNDGGGGAFVSTSIVEGSWVIVSGTSSTVTVPNPKAVFINFMVGMDDVTNTPSLNGLGPYNRYEVFIDGVASGLYLIIQVEVGKNLQAALSGVRSLTAGNHTIDVRARRWQSSGVPPATGILYRTLSSVLDVSYLN